MINGVYLSEAIDMSDLQFGRINLINSNCGSGKSYFAINELSKKASHLSNVVYLTDSVAMRDKLANNSNCKIYDPSDKDILNGRLISFEEDKIIVMTYAKMGLLLKYYPNTFDGVEIIICDEIHKIKDFIDWSRKDIKKKFPAADQKEIDYWITVSCGAYLAATYIERMAAGINLSDNNEQAVKQKLIVALSATPANAYVLFTQSISEIRINAQLVAYETLHTIYYTELASVIRNLESGIKAIFYVPRVSDIKKSIEIARQMGFRANGIWSLTNSAHPMDNEQKEIRKYILEKEELPPTYDFIFINAAYETSINIRGDVNCMIIHTTDKDKRTQARNRYRGDLETQYLLLDKKEKSSLRVPVEFLNKPLPKEKKDELCAFLNFRNSSGNKVGWPTTKKYLIEAGYEIEDVRASIDKKQRNCSIIRYKEES